jgi:hypothetical protein
VLNNKYTSKEMSSLTRTSTRSSLNETSATRTGTSTRSVSTSVSKASASSSANTDLGFIKTNNSLRSILYHPIALPLTTFLNDKQSSYLPDDYWQHWQTNENIKDDYDAYRENFCKFVDENDLSCNWDGKSEKSFVSVLKKKSDDFNIFLTDNYTNRTKKPRIIVEKEKCIGDSRERVDVIFSELCDIDDKDTTKSVVSIMEFGIGNAHWWKKVDQILKYFAKLIKNEKNDVNQPIVLSIITIDKIKEKGTIDSRIGVFLCTRKGINKYRIALLWRKKISNLKEVTKEFVKICASLHFLASSRQSKMKEYKYLGPNCCKIGSKVSNKPFILFLPLMILLIVLCVSVYTNCTTIGVSMLRYTTPSL